MKDLRRQYLEAMDLPVWVERRLRSPSRESGEGADTPVQAHSQVVGDAATADWDTLGQLIRNCSRCELHRTRQQAVVGVGNRQARLLVIGEAPGQEEDRQGEPFVGRAGKLLNAMLRAIGLERDAVYIANVLKCRPPNNRDPKPDESSTCAPFLDRQIALIAPEVILVLGRIAAQRLLQSDAPVGRLRGKQTELPGRGIPLIVSYHPAYLLRSPAAKAKAWHDLLLVKNLLESHA